MLSSTANFHRATSTPATEHQVAELVERAQTGELSAFDDLHRRYQHMVAAVVRSETRWPSDVDDLVQETFLRAWSSLGSLSDPHSFRSWLLQIARRIVLDHGRAMARRPFLAGDDDTALWATPAAVLDPFEWVVIEELAARLRSGVHQLAPRDALAINLATAFGLSPAEMATTLGTTTKNAKVVLCRARQRLRSCLDEAAPYA